MTRPKDYSVWSTDGVLIAQVEHFDITPRSESMTPEEEAAWAERYYKCPTHPECLGPTGTWQKFPCGVCKVEQYVDTCWKKGRRVPSVEPVLCESCSAQGVLL